MQFKLYTSKIEFGSSSLRVSVDTIPTTAIPHTVGKWFAMLEPPAHPWIFHSLYHLAQVGANTIWSMISLLSVHKAMLPSLPSPLLQQDAESQVEIRALLH